MCRLSRFECGNHQGSLSSKHLMKYLHAWLSISTFVVCNDCTERNACVWPLYNAPATFERFMDGGLHICQEYVYRFGVSLELDTLWPQGTNFESSVFAEMCRVVLCISETRTTAYNPKMGWSNAITNAWWTWWPYYWLSQNDSRVTWTSAYHTHILHL